MFHTVLQYCKKEKLIEEGDLVLAGVSGGADSVCLLLLLKELQKEITFSLAAVHVEHGIRGAESEADAAFVEKLCKEQKVFAQVYHVQAPEYAKEHKIGLEEAARILRYDCYMRAADDKRQRRVKIALAHHADDNAETVLFQMIRGSGIDGLGGMQPKRVLEAGVEVIRPLLGVTRMQIEAYLLSCGQAFCVDSSNSDVTYSRNKLRKEVLPLFSDINAQAVAHINQSAAYLRDLAAYLQTQVLEAAELVLYEEEGSIVISQQMLKEQPEILQKEILHMALVKVAGVAKDIGANHVEALAELFDLQVGRRISLPYGILAKRIYEGVILCHVQAEVKMQEKCGGQECGTGAESSVIFEIDKETLTKHLQSGCYDVEVPQGVARFQLWEREGESREISKNTYTKCFDYDKMKGSFQIRTRKEGDYLIVDENQHRKRLKEYFINEKIPKERRDKTLLLAESDKVIWVIGGRISADVKISDQTTKILKVQIIGGNYHEN